MFGVPCTIPLARAALGPARQEWSIGLSLIQSQGERHRDMVSALLTKDPSQPHRHGCQQARVHV